MAELILSAIFLWAAVQGPVDGPTIAAEAVLLAWCVWQARLAWRRVEVSKLYTIPFALGLALLPTEAAAEVYGYGLLTCNDMWILKTKQDMQSIEWIVSFPAVSWRSHTKSGADTLQACRRNLIPGLTRSRELTRKATWCALGSA